MLFRSVDLRTAIVHGARLRYRPILMTAAATIFALLPMALGLTGGGVFISKPLAIVVIGGLVSSTLLTLILVPVLYLLLEGVKERRAEKKYVKNMARGEVLDAAEARADGRVPERVPAGAGGAESEAATASTASAAGTAAEGPSQSEHSTTSEASRPLDGSSQSEDPAPEGSGPSEDSTQGGASGQGEPNPGGASGDSTTDFTLRSSNPRSNDGGSEPKH